MRHLNLHFFNKASRSLLGFAICFLFSQGASAEDYYWTVSSLAGRQFSSPAVACETHRTERTVYVSSSYSISSPSAGVCSFINNSGASITGVDLKRWGDSCSAGEEYNFATGECVRPPNTCESTNGQTILHQHLIKAAVGQPSTEPPGSVCANSCQYTWAFTAPTNVYAYTSGNPPGVFGSYEYKSAGLECTGGEPTRTAPAGTSDTTNPDDTPTPDPDNTCPEGYGWNGTFCSKEPPKPCDPDVEVGGCDDAENPDPEDTTDPEDPGDGEGDGDGSGDGNGSGDGDGSGDGEGTGEGDGEGDGTGDGEGDGEGEGETECDPTTDPDKCVKSSVTGEACDAQISCKGDAVQCAILKQQKTLRCQTEEQADFEKKKTEIEALFEGDKFEVKEETIEIPSFIGTGTRFLPSSCPQAENLSLRTGGGRQMQLSYQPLCTAASDFSNFFVAMALMWAAIYVGRSF